MNAQTIKNEAKRVKAKYGSADPFEICEERHIQIIYQPMGTSPGACKGFYLLNCRCKAIVLNSEMPEDILIKNQILDYELIESDKYLASLNLPEKSLRTAYWHMLTRLRSAETFPLMIETSYLPQSRFMALEPNIIQDGSLYAYLENYYNMEITDADELFSPILPTSKERMLLQIPTHIACMLCERFCQERDNLIAIHRTVVRGDKFKFRAAYFLDS